MADSAYDRVVKKQHGPISIAVFVDPMFQENSLVIATADRDADCWIVDPGFDPQPDDALAAVRERELRPAAIVLTHCHVDHIAGIATIRAEFPDIPIWCPADERHMLIDPMANFSGLYGVPIVAPEADRLVRAGERLTLGGQEFAALDVAGHSPGGLAYYCAAAGVVIGGDALFSGGIGRYDFPGSSGERLIANIRANLLTLPPETVLYAGHGPSTTIGREARYNPYLQPGFPL